MKTFDPECNNRKRCRWCGFLKPLEEFYTSKAAKDGFRTRCKVCIKVEQRERERERKKKHTIKGKMQAEIDELKAEFSDFKLKCDAESDRDTNLINEFKAENERLTHLIEKAKEIFESGVGGLYVNGVYISHKQACIIYSMWLKERLENENE